MFVNCKTKSFINICLRAEGEPKGSNLDSQYFADPLELLLELLIDLRSLLDSGDCRVDSGILKTAGKLSISLNRKPAYLCPSKKAAASAPLPRAAASASQFCPQTSPIAFVIFGQSKLNRSFERSPVCSRRSPFKTPSTLGLSFHLPI